MVICVEAVPSTSRRMPSVSFKVNAEYGRLTELVPGLFICGVSAINEDMLKQYNFSYIINATSEVTAFSFSFFFFLLSLTSFVSQFSIDILLTESD